MDEKIREFEAIQKKVSIKCKFCGKEIVGTKISQILYHLNIHVKQKHPGLFEPKGEPKRVKNPSMASKEKPK